MGENEARAGEKTSIPSKYLTQKTWRILSNQNVSSEEIIKKDYINDKHQKLSYSTHIKVQKKYVLFILSSRVTFCFERILRVF